MVTVGLFSTLMLGGCSYHQDKVSKDFSTEAAQIVAKDSKPLLEKIVTIKNKKTGVELTRPKKIGQVLHELGEVEDRIYVVDMNSENIDVPTLQTNSYQIKNFKMLQDYIYDRTNYEVEIIKNKFVKGVPKIVAISHRANKNFKSSYISFQAKNMAVADIFDKIAQATGYNVAFSQDDSRNTGGLNSEEIDYIKARHMSFSQDNTSAFEALNYLSNALNLFIEIDHQNKLITVNKYKVKYFKLAMNNLDIQGSMEAESLSSGDVSNEMPAQAKTASQVAIKVFDELEEDITSVLQRNNKFDQQKGYIRIDKITGEVTVRSSKKSMEQIQSMIQRFNDTYGKTVEFELDVFEILVKRDLGGGVDVSLIKDALARGTALSLETNFNANPQMQITGTSTNRDITAAVEAMNEFGKVVNRKTYVFRMHNHIPYSRVKATTVTYTKKSSLVQTGTTPTGAPLYNIERETGELRDGFVFVGKPMVDGQNISMNLNLSFSTILELKEVTVGDERYQEPEISNDTFTGEIKIRNGERFVIDSLSVKGKAENYKGIVPINNFIIGGNMGNQYVEREIVLVGSARVRR